jgi:hypothetical protein
MAIRHEAVVDNWSVIVSGGAGHGQNVLNNIEQEIKEANMPNVTTGQQDISGGIFGSKRKFLCVNHNHLRDYRIYIGARDYGTHLDVGWYMTIQPGFLKRNISKYTTGSPQALSWQIDFFSQQDLHAFVTVIHHIVKQVAEGLFEELKLDPSGLRDARSKGFLAVW